MFLHGCVGQGCSKVWGPGDDGDRCELCESNRYDNKGNPREFVVHFPLRERLKSLFACPQYCESVRWEYNRSQGNDEYITGKHIHT